MQLTNELNVLKICHKVEIANGLKYENNINSLANTQKIFNYLKNCLKICDLAKI